MKKVPYTILFALTLFSCSVQRQVKRSAHESLIDDPLLQYAHVGLSVYDPAAGKYLFNHQAEKYFVPASNTKIITCYAAMKYLGKQMPGMGWTDLDTAILLFPTGDPTFLHPDFMNQPVMDFLRGTNKPLYISDRSWMTTSLGSGWSWDDYSEYYMAERSPLPVYGNVIRWKQSAGRKEHPNHPGDTVDVFIYSEPEINWPVDFSAPDPAGRFNVKRDRDKNRFVITEGRERSAVRDVPFSTNGLSAGLSLLRDTLHRSVSIWPEDAGIRHSAMRARFTLPSGPLDSMLRPMMHRSDNFFAEQALLMTGNHMTGRFREDEAIDSMLRTSLAGMPQKPRWVDGSGLSRYNLFSPMDFVWVLDRMREDFGMDRIMNIFPTPGTGTLKSYGADLSGRIFAKTGTLSGVVALSGFVHTRKGKWLVFSILVNNHRRQPQELRNRMEAFLKDLVDRH